jgi:hypothetical protein
MLAKLEDGYEGEQCVICSSDILFVGILFVMFGVGASWVKGLM